MFLYLETSMIINNNFQYNTYNPGFAARFIKADINLPKKELQTQIKKGVTVETIANQHGVSCGYIYKLMGSFGILTSKQQRLKQIQEQMKLLDEKMPSLISRNASLKEIVKEIGCNTYVIKKWCLERLNKTFLKSKIQTRIDRVKELNEQGFNNKEMSQQLGVTDGTVRKTRQKYNLFNKPDTQQKCADLIFKKSIQGESVKKIAEQLNLSMTTVYKYRKQTDVKNELTKERLQLIENMLKQGFSIRQIAQKLEMTEGYLYKYLKKQDLRQIAHGYKEELARKIVEKYKQGVPLNRIAQELNVSPRTVSYKIHDYKARRTE